MEKPEPLEAGGDMKWSSRCGEQFDGSLSSEPEFPYDPAVPPVGALKAGIPRDPCVSMSVATLFKQPSVGVIHQRGR